MRHYQVVAMMLVCGWLLRSPSHAVGFLPGPDVTIGDVTARVTAVDVDRDGFDDLVATLRTRSTVAILWNQGLPAPQFDLPQLFGVGIDVARAVFADFNGDGRLDLAAVPVAAQDQLAVRLSDGARSFAPATSITLPVGDASGWRCIAVADVDGDLRLDLVVAEMQSLVVLRGRGDGSFDLPRVDGVPAGRVVEMFIGDLDGQPGIDVLLGLETGAQAWVNDGAGRLVSRPAFPSGTVETYMAAGDVDGDARLDAVATHLGSVVIFLNDGSGQFSALPPAPAGLFAPRQTAVHDVNRDAYLDLLSTTDGSEWQVRYGLGGGSFTVPVSVTATPSPNTEILTGDFNGDGADGDVAYEIAADQLSLRVSAGAVILGTPQSLPVGSRPVGLALGDFDGDGRIDLVSANRAGGDLSHYRNTGAGFAPLPPLVTGGAPLAVADPDLDRDGWRDVVALLGGSESGASASAVVGELVVFRNLGGAGFEPPRRLAVGQGPMGLAAGDLNADGRGDVVVIDRVARTATPYLASGGWFVPAAAVALDLEPVALVLADFDGDLELDLAVAGLDSLGGGGVRVFPSLGGGGFGPPSSLATGMGPSGMTSVDLDVDGLADLAIIAGSELLVARGLGGLAFSPWTAHALAGEAVAIGRGFMNCDAAEDLLVSAVSASAAELQVWLSEGDGGLAPPQHFSTGMGPASIVAGNLDGVGADDPVVAASEEDRALVSLNSACPGAGPCAAPSPTIAVETPVCSDHGARFAASAGYARYRWANGATERTMVTPSPEAGSRTMTVEAWDARGCEVQASEPYEVMSSPELAVWADQYYACANVDVPTTIPVHAVVTNPAVGLTLQWIVDTPGSVFVLGKDAAEVTFPPRTPEGFYSVSATASDVSTCSTSSAMTLRFLGSGTPAEGSANSFRMARAGSGVVLRWEAQPGTLAAVFRGLSPADMTEIASAVDTGELVDVPGTNLSLYYSVRPWSACASGLLAP